MTNVNNVSFGKPKVSGAISIAPLGTTLPKDAVSELDAEFKSLGYVNEDGLTNENSPETETRKAWGGDTVLSVAKERPDKFKFTLIEALNVEVLKLVYGAKNVTGTLDTQISIKATTEILDAHAIVIDMILQGGLLKRVVIPHAVVSDVGEITYKDDEEIGYETTINALPVDGATHQEYIAKAGA